MANRWLLIIAMLTVGWAVWPRPSLAQSPTFNMHHVLDDEDVTDVFSMSRDRIQAFLDAQPGVLKTETFTVNDQKKSAATIIYEAAQANTINPKLLLATIQKESSMITRSIFRTDQYSGSKQYYLDWVVFYGWCDSCSSGSKKGFYNQINAAAYAFNVYLRGDLTVSPPKYGIKQNGYTISGWGPDRTKSVPCLDSDFNNGRELCTPGTNITITPVNAATAIVYTYTPHPGGNYSLFTIWNNFNFGLHRIYPDGSLLKTKASADIWIIKNGLRQRFANKSAFLSRYSPQQVITVPADHLALYDTGANIQFANYSLLKSPKGGIYLLVDSTKRPIKSMAAFKSAGFRKEEIIAASWDDLNAYTDSDPVTMENLYPSGILFQNKVNGSIHFVQDGIRHPVISKAILRSQFGLRKPVSSSPEKLAAYTVGEPVKFKDGDIVSDKDGGPVYVISNGLRLRVASAEAFKAYRFSWANVTKVDAKSLTTMPDGPVLDVDGIVQLASQ